MEEKEHNSLLPWISGFATLVLGVVVVALFISDRRPEPGRAYRFDVSEFQERSRAGGDYQEVQTIALPAEKPTAVALGPEGEYFVASEGRIDLLNNDGLPVKTVAVEGMPRCLFRDGEKLYACVDDHIEIRDLEGEILSIWPPFSRHSWLTSLTLQEDNLYAADAALRAILHYDHEWNFLKRIGERDPDDAIPGIVVSTPYLDVAVDPMGLFWTTNPGRHGLESYRSTGEPITSWYRPSMDIDGFCGCSNPAHIAFMENGNLVTAEHGLSRVKIYSPDHQLIALVEGPESFGESPDKMLGPDQNGAISDLAVDASGRIIVLDGRKSELRIFQKKKEMS